MMERQKKKESMQKQCRHAKGIPAFPPFNADEWKMFRNNLEPNRVYAIGLYVDHFGRIFQSNGEETSKNWRPFLKWSANLRAKNVYGLDSLVYNNIKNEVEIANPNQEYTLICEYIGEQCPKGFSYRFGRCYTNKMDKPCKEMSLGLGNSFITPHVRQKLLYFFSYQFSTNK